MKNIQAIIEKIVPSQYQWDNKPYIKDGCIYMEWETGGVSGGSCWESSDPQPYTCDNPEPSFDVLDKIIEAVMPDLSYMNYKKLCFLIETGTRHQREYYGNCVNYRFKKIDVAKLCTFFEGL